MKGQGQNQSQAAEQPAARPLANNTDFGIVVIGRNEGDRLRQCLISLPLATVVYVDSGSTDRSVEWAREFGVSVVELDMSIPFTAARARNAGFRLLKKINPNTSFIQFVDGDCQISEGWSAIALAFLQTHDEVAATFGRIRERYPHRTIYNQLCDWEWEGPTGETRAFPGIVMLRASALEGVSGYLDKLIAGEEPELAVRLRAAGWRIWRLADEMTLHDAAIMHFHQWWRRCIRSGYAFAAGSYLHGAPPESHWVWESRRAWIWGIILPLICVCAPLVLGLWGLAMCTVYPAQMLRQFFRNSGTLHDRAVKAFFQILGRFPEGIGQLKFVCDRMFNRQGLLIEYK
jgi:glycosyltransferase involved in cell wall biosynthesis